MKALKIRTANLVIFTCLLFSACGPKPWPEDSLSQLKQSGVLSDESKMVSLLSNTNENTYLECVIVTYKQSFPDYADFEKTAKDNPQQIKMLRINCIKRFAGNDINSIWNIIENNEGVRNLKFQLSENYYIKYKSLMMANFRNEFQTMNNFIDKLTSDESYVSTFIYNSDKQCGEIIKNEIEQERIAHQSLQFPILSNSLPNANTEQESTSGFKMRAYPIGKMGNNGLDIIVNLKNIADRTLVTVKFAYKANKSEEYLATKNPNYNIIDPNANKYGIKLSDYNYIFTSSYGEVWGFLLDY